MKMDDPGVRPASSIMNYFQREKSPEVTKLDPLTKSEKTTDNPKSADLKEDNLHVGESCHSKSENTDDPLNECVHNATDNSNCVVDCNIGDSKTKVQGDCFEGNKSTINDCSNTERSDDFRKSEVCGNEQSGKKGKLMWNFTWKSKTKKTKTIEASPDSDSDFETNNELTETGSKPCGVQGRISKTKTQKDKVSKSGKKKGKRTNPSLKVHDTKPNDNSDSANIEICKLQLSLAPEKNNCTGQSRSDSILQSNKRSSSSTKVHDKKRDEVSDSGNKQTSKLQISISPESCVESKSDSIHTQTVTNKSSCSRIKTSNVRDKQHDKATESTCTTTSKLLISLSSESDNCVVESTNESLSNERGTSSSTKSPDETCDEVVDSTSTQTCKLQISLSPESATECSRNEKSSKDIEAVSGKVHLETCANTQPDSVYESTKVSKSGLESTKGSYFDILMKGSREKARAKQNSSGQSIEQKLDNGPWENTKKSKMEDSARNGGKKGKACKTSRRKKNTSAADNVCETGDEEAALSSPRKKQNRSSVKDSKQSKNEANEKLVEKSTRRNRTVRSRETVSESNSKEAPNIAYSSGEDRTKPLIRSRRATTLGKTMPRRKENPEETTQVVCLDKQLDSEETGQKIHQSVLVSQTDCSEEIEPTVEESNQSSKEDGKGNCGETISTEQKRGRSRHLRKRNILDSDDEEGSTNLQKETKHSTNEMSKSKNDNQPITKGPIAPIFLPGAWRRAKAKLEEAERLETTFDAAETLSPLRSSQSCSLPTGAESDNLVVDVCQHSPATNETAASMAAFLGMFQKPSAKPCAVVVQFIEAPFPKVSHVRQQDDEINKKWNLSMVRNRFVKEEYFFWPDEYNSMVERNLSTWFLGTDISCSEEGTAANSKCIQLKTSSLEMDKSQKQRIVSYLKTVYQGIPIMKLFKRCHRQLEICKKAEAEVENAGLLVKTKYFKQARSPCIKGPAVPASNFTTPVTSTQISGKSESFTKISRKKSTAKVKAKSVKKKESPLLLAFKKQESKKQENAACSSKKEEVVNAKPKKRRGKKTSIMDFMGIQTKQSGNIPENKLSAQSKKRKKNTKRKVDGVGEQRKENPGGVDREMRECKKRARESEDDGSKSCVAEETVRPTVKKVKLLSATQEFKKPKKGQKRKLRNVESKENTDVVEIKNGETKSLENPLKCRKISSDDDFVKPQPPRRSQENRKCKLNKSNDIGVIDTTVIDTAVIDTAVIDTTVIDTTVIDTAVIDTTVKDTTVIDTSVIDTTVIDTSVKDTTVKDTTVKDSGNETRGLRKSRRLQEKSSAEQADKQEVETCDGNKESDVIEVNADCLIQGEQIEKNKVLDIKVVKDMTPVSVVDNACAEQSSRGDVNTGTGNCASWSECFKPRNSLEILGNNSSGTRLKNWLSEWKTLRERKLEAMKRHEEKKRQRSAAKKGSKATSSSWWYDDDDSDFCSSDESDENVFNEENVRNTMLLSGPVGCGKTSAVYACAEELGFKVIEVNSSTKRGGKYILSELLEATQSHQVSTKRNLPPGQSALFPHADSSAHDSGKKKEVEREVKKNTKVAKKQKKKEQDSQLQGQMSLILLDEVDVLFEEDKGFWVSVNTLRQNSKRPIVMTALDTSAVDVDGEFEHIMLKTPSLKLYAAYLQTICLTKNIFVNPSDIVALSWLHHGDIRRLLLSLQFWGDSNAGAWDEHGVMERSDFGTGAESVATNENPPDKTKGVSLLEFRNEGRDSELVNNYNSTKKDLLLNTQDKCDVEVNATGMELIGPKINTAVMDNTESKIPAVTEVTGPKIDSADIEVTNAAGVEVTGPKINAAGVEVGRAKIITSVVDGAGPNSTSSSDVEKPNTTDIHQLCEKGLSTKNQKVSEYATSGCSGAGELTHHEVKGNKIVLLDEKKIDYTLCEVVGGLDKQDSSQKPNDEILSSEKDKVSLGSSKHIEMHQLCLESLLGLRNVNNNVADVLETLKSDLNAENSFHKKCLVTSHCQGLNIDTVYCNMETLLPCVFCSLNTVKDCPVKTHAAVSGDHLALDKTMFHDAKQESNDCESKSSEHQGDEGMQDETCVNRTSEIKDDARIHDDDLVSKKLVGISLACLEQVYEDMSFMDSELCYDRKSWQGFESWSATISPGLSDTVGKDSPGQTTWKTVNATNELRGALEVACLEHSHSRFRDLCYRSGERVRKYASELMTGACSSLSLENQDTAGVSDMDGVDSCAGSKAKRAHLVDANTKICPKVPCLQVTISTESLSRFRSQALSNTKEPRTHAENKIRKREQQYTTISSYLSESSHLNRGTIVVDYLPSLRTMCHNESLRKASRVKRRFYHYLDSIGLHISSSGIQSLTEDSYFNVT